MNKTIEKILKEFCGKVVEVVMNGHCVKSIMTCEEGYYVVCDNVTGIAFQPYSVEAIEGKKIVLNRFIKGN